MILIFLIIVLCILILASIFIKALDLIVPLHYEEDVDLVINKTPPYKIEFTLYKDNIKIGEYIYYNDSKKKVINKTKFENFVRLHVCKFFDRMEITYPK